MLQEGLALGIRPSHPSLPAASQLITGIQAAHFFAPPSLKMHQAVHALAPIICNRFAPLAAWAMRRVCLQARCLPRKLHSHHEHPPLIHVVHTVPPLGQLSSTTMSTERRLSLLTKMHVQNANYNHMNGIFTLDIN